MMESESPNLTLNWSRYLGSELESESHITRNVKEQISRISINICFIILYLHVTINANQNKSI